MFEYREGTVIDGGQFRGWAREWGNGGGADGGKVENALGRSEVRGQIAEVKAIAEVRG